MPRDLSSDDVDRMIAHAESNLPEEWTAYLDTDHPDQASAEQAMRADPASARNQEAAARGTVAGLAADVDADHFTHARLTDDGHRAALDGGAEPHHHFCLECGDHAVPDAPAAGPWADTTAAIQGGLPSWSHTDGEPLCPVVGPDGYEPAQPEPWYLPADTTSAPAPADDQADAPAAAEDPGRGGRERNPDVYRNTPEQQHHDRDVDALLTAALDRPRRVDAIEPEDEAGRDWHDRVDAVEVDRGEELSR